MLKIYFLILSILFSNSLDAEIINHKIKINHIAINGKSQSDSSFSNLVLASTDSITIDYSCINSDYQKIGYFYRLAITNVEQSSSFTTNNSQIRYKALPEGIFKLSISAFDPRLKWESDTILVNFRVNNHEKELINQLSVLNQKIDSTNINNTSNNTKTGLFDYKSLIIGIISGLGIFLVIFLIFQKLKKNSKNIGKNNMPSEIPKHTDHEEFKRLQAENNKLSNEINILRTQITNLSTRTNELALQNNELKEQIDKLAKNQDDIQSLQSQKDDLFTMVIHDIKNPAALIKSLIDLLRSYDLNAQEQSEIIDNIFETTMKIVSLSTEVTKILSLESKSLMLNIEPAPLNEIVTDVYKRNSIGAKAKEIELLLDITPDLPDVPVDAQKVDEVLDNLFSNAIKFSHRGGKVKITTRRDGKNAVVEVSDNGLGLSEEDIHRAFNRGARLSAQPTAGEPSSGFGLWIVKKLIEAHNGHVWVKSKLGVGSTFAVSLPFEETNQTE